MKSVQTPAVDVRSALQDGMARLQGALVSSAALAAELLLIHALGCDRTFLYSHPEHQLVDDVKALYFALIARRASGEPLQYLTGRQEFWGLDFEVTPAVLIPRPETEHLIEVVLDRIGPARRTGALQIADVGTGSGCIAVALAKELPAARIVATDISAEALAVAERNAWRHSVRDRIRFVQSDLLGAIEPSTRFDVIASNPPYVALGDAPTLPHEVRDHEPHAALFGGPSGVEIYGRLIEQAPRSLLAGGALVLELGYDSADRVRAMIDGSGAWSRVVITNDLAGIRRVLAAEQSQST
jgi:release factor glutamine methyltransferase